MRVLLVSGPWGSGTSITVKLLAAMGAFAPEPHFITNDPRTGDSFESAPFDASGWRGQPRAPARSTRA
jgi:hypothetical protein